MNLLNLSKLCCLFALSNQLLLANGYDFNTNLKPDSFIPKSCSSDSVCDPKCIYATSDFSTNSNQNRYQITVRPFPKVVRLSLNRISGFTRGDIELTSRGVRILKSGDYWISFGAILQNEVPNTTPQIEIFVVRNGKFNPNDHDMLNSQAQLPTGFPFPIQNSGIIKKLKRGTRLSIVASCLNNPNPVPITVVEWDMSLFKIPCCDLKKKD